MLSCANDEELKEVEELIISLGYSGIGGKRSSGLGRFDIQIADDADELLNMITEKSRLYMTLSVSLPKECEITNSLSEAKYSIIKRSGFISSQVFDDRRKKDLYVIAAGACVKNKYEGDIYDVADGGVHPVYRYAKPLFMGVNI